MIQYYYLRQSLVHSSFAVALTSIVFVKRQEKMYPFGHFHAYCGKVLTS